MIPGSHRAGTTRTILLLFFESEVDTFWVTWQVTVVSVTNYIHIPCTNLVLELGALFALCLCAERVKLMRGADCVLFGSARLPSRV